MQRFAALSLLICFTAQAALAEQHADTTPAMPVVVPTVFVRAQTIGTMMDAVHTFRWRGREYSLSARGALSTRRNGHLVRRHVDFSSGPDDWIDNLYVAEYRGDLVVVGEIDNGVEGAGFATRLAASDLRARWKAWIDGFNVGQPLLHGPHAYVTAIGFVGKLNLQRGKYAWRHTDLYSRNPAFNDFAVPILQGSTVVFVGEGPYGHSGNEILVDDRSGHLLAFRTTPSP